MIILRTRRTRRNESVYEEIRFYDLNSTEIRVSRLGCYLIGSGSCWPFKFLCKEFTCILGKWHHFRARESAYPQFNSSERPPSVLPMTSTSAWLSDPPTQFIHIISTVILLSGFPVKREEIGYFQHQKYTAPSRRWSFSSAARLSFLMPWDQEQWNVSTEDHSSWRFPLNHRAL